MIISELPLLLPEQRHLRIFGVLEKAADQYKNKRSADQNCDGQLRFLQSPSLKGMDDAKLTENHKKYSAGRLRVS
jgi:hypothetical protein